MSENKICPKCGSNNINEIITNGFQEEKEAIETLDAYPIRPCVEFECEDCKARWENPKYEEYLLHRIVNRGK